MLRINDVAPDFTAETTAGPIRFHEWIGDRWAVLFSHPKDFTPVCTTELGYMAGLLPDFEARGVRIIGLSADPIESHTKWVKDIHDTQGHAVKYPLIADGDLEVAKLYGMLPADAVPGQRTPADNQTVRTVMVIGPDKKIKAMIVYPMSTGRNFDEVLRLIDSLQMTSRHGVSTPVNWMPGEDVIVPAAWSEEEIAKKHPGGFKKVLPYLRYVAAPEGAADAVGAGGEKK